MADEDIFDFVDTWNDGATTYNAIKVNVTDTASAPASKLIDLQVGASSKFSVDKTGSLAVDNISGTLTNLGLDKSIEFTVITEAGTSRTLALSDQGAYIRTTSGGAVTINLPAQATVAWGDYTEIIIQQGGAGQVTIVPAGGVTVNSSESLKTAFQHSQITLKKVGTNTWVCGGDREEL